MRNGARAALVWGYRCFLRDDVVFYAQATGVQEENQIGRGAAENLRTDSVLFGQLPSLPLAWFWCIGLCNLGKTQGVEDLGKPLGKPQVFLLLSAICG